MFDLVLATDAVGGIGAAFEVLLSQDVVRLHAAGLADVELVRPALRVVKNAALKTEFAGELLELVWHAVVGP